MLSNLKLYKLLLHSIFYRLLYILKLLERVNETEIRKRIYYCIPFMYIILTNPQVDLFLTCLKYTWNLRTHMHLTESIVYQV